MNDTINEKIQLLKLIELPEVLHLIQAFTDEKKIAAG